ncbi:hypothetical protein LINPERHAP2_LOCUS19365 [Linum perenne]
MGVLIQGDSHRDFTSILQKCVAVGSVYVILNFSVCSPCPSFRTCAFPHCLGITTSTKFELQQSPEPPFLSNAFDFEPIASLPARAHPCPYLPAVLRVDVFLWAKMSSILDAGTIVIDDQERPLIVGFSGFRIGSFDGRTTAGSSHLSRVIVQPNHATADALLTLFTTKARPITYTPSKFNTPEKLKKHVEDSYRTIHELHVMHAEGGDSVSRLTLLMLHSSYLYAISFTSLVCRNPVTDASPPRRHNTPLPPDPRYVPPVPMYDPSLKAAPELPVLDLNPSKLNTTTPSKFSIFLVRARPSHVLYDLLLNFNSIHAGLFRGPRLKVMNCPSRLLCVPSDLRPCRTSANSISCRNTSWALRPHPTRNDQSSCGYPLASHPSAQVLSPSVPPFTSLQQASLSLASSPLAKVKQECLSDSPTIANPPRIDTTQTSSSLSLQGPRKCLFPS